MFHERESVFAVSTPTRSDPIRPGPTVTAIASMSSQSKPAFSSAFSMTGMMYFICSLAATSGIIPPVCAWEKEKMQ